MMQAQQEEKSEQIKDLVIVTGFGKFVGHETINASWEAVRLLPSEIVYGNRTYKVQKFEIPVEYDAVDEAVEKIWLLEPSLVIHCGVNGHSSCVHVEKLAYNNCFVKQDFAGKHLDEGKACLKNCPTKKSALFCKLNVKKIVETITDNCACTVDSIETVSPANANGTIQKVAKVSKDVGNYLCGYIYLKSLDHDSSKTLFVHVPPLDKPFGAEKLSEVILKITQECLRQVVEGVEVKTKKE